MSSYHISSFYSISFMSNGSVRSGSQVAIHLFERDYFTQEQKHELSLLVCSVHHYEL